MCIPRIPFNAELLRAAFLFRYLASDGDGFAVSDLEDLDGALQSEEEVEGGGGGGGGGRGGMKEEEKEEKRTMQKEIEKKKCYRLSEG